MKNILHFIGKLNPGGIEIWLREILKISTKYPNTKHYFLVLSNRKGTLDSEFEKYGAKIIFLRSMNPIYLYYKLNRLNFEYKLTIYHIHIHFASAYILFISLFLIKRVKTIVHSHNDTRFIQSSSNRFRKLYFLISNRLIIKFSDLRLACSSLAGKALFKNNSFEIQPYCIDFNKFGVIDEKFAAEFKKNFSISNKEKIIGHVGSFSPQKNHKFLIDIFYELSKIRNDVILVLIGEGVLKEKIIRKVKKLNLQKKVIFYGFTDKVNLFFKNIFDLFLFPTNFEGLGIVLLEAQAANLKSITSDVIPEEVIINKHIVKLFSLDESHDFWAKKCDEILNSSKTEELNLNSIYTIKNSSRILENYYEQI